MTATLEAHLDRALAELGTSNRRLLAVCDLSVSLGTSLDATVVVRQLAKETARLLAAPSVTVALHPDLGGGGAEHPGPYATAYGRSILSQLEVRDREPADPVELEDGPTVILPLSVDQRPAGALAIRTGAAGLDPADLWLALTAAAAGSRALQACHDHARGLEAARLEAEYALAAAVQDRLRPGDLPTVAGLDLAVHSEAALGGVGGDLLDHRAHADGVLVAVGDVTGKGASAAMVLTAAQMTLRRLLDRHTDARPSDLLDRLTDELHPFLSELGTLMTLALVHVSSDDGVAEIVSAGHSPVVLHRRGGTPRLLLPTHAPLGVDSEPADPRSVLLRPGDRIVAATDGLHEHEFDGGADVGLTTVLSTIERLDRTDELVAGLRALVPGSVQDDLTVAVLAREVPPCGR